MTTNRYHAEARTAAPGRPLTDWTVVDQATDAEIARFALEHDGRAKAERLAALLEMDLRLGDVVLDSYANPAVIVRVTSPGTRFISYEIMQTAGSDRGRVTSLYTDSLPQRVTDSHRVERARATVRAEAKRRGYRWDAQGITR